MPHSRRRFLSAAAAEIGLASAGCIGLSTAESPTDGPTVAFVPVAEGFTSPLGFEAPPGVDARYVVDQVGTVSILDGGSGSPSTFLDLTDRVVDVSGYDERGLLGLAFHPAFPDDGRVFVRYSAPSRPGTPDGYSHTFVLSEFSATPDGADPETERTLLEIPEPQSNHNSGAVLFGPDGYLYVGTGDGGAGGDQGRGHVEDWYDAVRGGNGQDVTENLLGSVLRIDVDGRGDDRPYAVPDDNPLVGRAGLDEQYAWGFRNPWRMSFDGGGNLLVADVGQNAYEEVDRVVAGGNYGWNVREGTHCYGAADCPDRTPGDVRGGEPLRDPVVEYPHDLGIAVIGGHVYRGSGVPKLRGEYVFGDWSGTDGGPTLFSATPDEEGLWSMRRLSIAEESVTPGRHLLAIGRGSDGELYVCTSDRSGVGGQTGAVHRLRSPAGTHTATTTPVPGTGTTGGGATPTDPTPTPSDGATSGTRGGDPTATGPDGTTSAPGQPGFGVGSAIAGLIGVAGYRVLRRWREDP